MSKSVSKLGFKILGRKVVVADPTTNFKTDLIITESARKQMAEEQIKTLAKTEVLAVGEAIDHIKPGDMICIKQMSRGRFEIIEMGEPKKKSVIETEKDNKGEDTKMYFVFDETDVLAIYE